MRFFHLSIAMLSYLGAATAASLPSGNTILAIAAREKTLEQHTHLRIEGLTDTIFEGRIVSGPRNITTPSGGTHLCDGTNLGDNPSPGNTPTDALDAASKREPEFTYDGTYSTEFEDFFITRISTSAETSTQFWGLLVNYQFTPVGGCQFQTKAGDDILWAFDAFNKVHFLKVTPDHAHVKHGGSLPVTVTDGSTGLPVQGALIDSVLTDADGNATLTFPKNGRFEYKATKDDSIRSNKLVVEV